MRGCAITTSWDDGHPLDMRVAELLARRGFTGTFYVPCRNQEGLPVISRQDLRSLSETVEIGAHTLDHVYLHSIPEDEAETQIAEGKRELEDSLGRAVDGFAYPGGHHNDRLHRLVAARGFVYARTTENFRADAGDDRYSVPTTFQLYPHGRQTYLRNFLKHCHYAKRFDLFAAAVSCRTLPDRLRAALDLTLSNGGIFHLWGHSWELDRIGGWQVLDDFLAYAAERVAPDCRLTNAAVLSRLEPAP